MKYPTACRRTVALPSPLAEGRELKSRQAVPLPQALPSPLAEGRELKFRDACGVLPRFLSPLAEGRELKLTNSGRNCNGLVAPRGGA